MQLLDVKCTTMQALPREVPPGTIPPTTISLTRSESREAARSWGGERLGRSQAADRVSLPSRPPHRRARRPSPSAGLGIEGSHAQEALPASPCSAVPAALRSPLRYSSSFCPQRTSRAGPAGAAMARGGRRDRREDVASLRTAPRSGRRRWCRARGGTASRHGLLAMSPLGALWQGAASWRLRPGERGGSPGSAGLGTGRLRSPGCLPQPRLPAPAPCSSGREGPGSPSALRGGKGRRWPPGRPGRVCEGRGPGWL